MDCHVQNSSHSGLVRTIVFAGIQTPFMSAKLPPSNIVLGRAINRPSPDFTEAREPGPSAKGFVGLGHQTGTKGAGTAAKGDRSRQSVLSECLTSGGVAQRNQVSLPAVYRHRLRRQGDRACIILDRSMQGVFEGSPTPHPQYAQPVRKEKATTGGQERPSKAPLAHEHQFLRMSAVQRASAYLT